MILLPDDKSSSSENKTFKTEASSAQQQSGRRTASTPTTGFPTNPFDFSTMSNLLNVIISLLNKLLVGLITLDYLV